MALAASDRRAFKHERHRVKGCLIALGIPVGLVVLFIGFWKLNYYDLHVRYRLTVEAQDGDQIKTGSSIIDAAYRIDPGWIWEGPHGYDPDIVGYAPTVDLGKEGMLFLTFEKTRTSFYERERYKQIPASRADRIMIRKSIRLRMIDKVQRPASK